MLLRSSFGFQDYKLLNLEFQDIFYIVIELEFYFDTKYFESQIKDSKICVREVE